MVLLIMQLPVYGLSPKELDSEVIQIMCVLESKNLVILSVNSSSEEPK
jgi:hypothetical protein